MSGETLDYKKHLSLQIGQYCQVHEEDTPHNSQNPRTKGAISLGPSGNLQGRFKFMALNTGKKITRYSWDVIPMPDTVIAQVNALGSDQPEQLVFTDKHGRLIGDDEIPGVDSNGPEPDADNIDDDVELPGVDVAENVQHEQQNQAPQTVEIDDLDITEPDPPPVDELANEETVAVPEPPIQLEVAVPDVQDAPAPVPPAAETSTETPGL
jgi:hypothetical protein